MSEVQRYILSINSKSQTLAEMVESTDGNYVTYADYAALKDENARLAAENAAAIDAVTVFSKATEDLTEIIGDEIGMEGVAKLLDGFNALGNLPATDAYLAEVRAQAVDEFASVIGKLCQSEKVNSVRYRVAKHIVFLAVSHAASIRTAAKGEGVSDE